MTWARVATGGGANRSSEGQPPPVRPRPKTARAKGFRTTEGAGYAESSNSPGTSASEEEFCLTPDGAVSRLALQPVPV